MGATVRTDETRALVLEAYSHGASDTVAAEFARIDRTTLWKWRKDDQQFQQDIKKAKADCAVECLKSIHGEKAWQARAWWLERQYPEDFSLVQRIEQVLKQHGLIAPGIAGQLDGGSEAGSREPASSND